MTQEIDRDFGSYETQLEKYIWVLGVINAEIAPETALHARRGGVALAEEATSPRASD